MQIFNGMYRGVCLSNNDPEHRGRVKIWIPGVYPEELAKNHTNLPWAEPCMGLFGGNGYNSDPADMNSETGSCTPPHGSIKVNESAQLWVFFENNDQNYPVYFAACQASTGWFSEHENQHVFQTDNIRIRIDENTADAESTTKFDSYNANCTYLSREAVSEDVPTRIDIEIWNENNHAINLQVKGNINMHVEGNIFKEVYGDIHETHEGNYYLRHKGSTHITQEGKRIIDHTGNTVTKVIGNQVTTIEGNDKYTRTGNTHFDQIGNIFKTVNGIWKNVVFGLYFMEVSNKIAIICTKGSIWIQSMTSTIYNISRTFRNMAINMFSTATQSITNESGASTTNVSLGSSIENIAATSIDNNTSTITNTAGAIADVSGSASVPAQVQDVVLDNQNYLDEVS